MFDADAQLAGHLRYLLDADAQGHVVIEHVAAFAERAVQVDIAVAGALPAVEAAVADLEMAGAVDGFGEVQLSGLERGQCHHHLEGRAGRVDALHRLVGQGPVFVFQQGLVIGDRDAAHEKVGVVAGGRGAGQQVARCAVDHHRRRAFLGQPCVGVGLQRVVDGDLDIGAGGAFLPFEFAHHPAGGVDLDPLGAGLAAQQLLALGLEPDLADLEAGDQQQGIGRVDPLEVAVADRADIAHDMGVGLAMGVAARQAHVGGDAGQGRGVDGDAADVFPADAVGDGDGRVAAQAFEVAAGAFQLLGVERDQLRQAGNHVFDVARFLAHHGDAVAGHVLGYGHAVAVEDAAAGRRDQADVDAVLVGEQAELVGLLDLEVAHAQGQGADEAGHGAADDQAAAGDLAVAFSAVACRASHDPGLIASSSPGATLRTPSRDCETSTTIGSAIRVVTICIRLRPRGAWSTIIRPRIRR